MENQKPNPSANLTATVNNTKKEPTLLNEMQGDISNMLASAAMEDPNLKPMLDKLKVAFPAILEMAKQKLGEDETRYMLWRDPETKSIVLETVKMSNFEMSYKKDPTSEDLFIIQENTDIDSLLKTIFTKIMPKMF